MKFLSEKGKCSIPRYKKKKNLSYSKDSSSVEIKFSDKWDC